MKKIGIINQPISAVVASLGHMDRIVICDAGLPIPEEAIRIDLALKEGTPGFLETVETILIEMQVERAVIADEISEHNPQVEASLRKILGDTHIDKISHEQFKLETKHAYAIVRTGEFSPYANVILVAGVVF